MSESLLAVLTGRSALQLLSDELESLQADYPAEASVALTAWHSAGLPHAIERIDVSLESFKLEGCNLAVSPAKRLLAAPRAHRCAALAASPHHRRRATTRAAARRRGRLDAVLAATGPCSRRSAPRPPGGGGSSRPSL